MIRPYTIIVPVPGGGGGPMTSKNSRLDIRYGMLSVGSPVYRNIWIVPGLLSRAVGISAVRWVLFTKVVANGVSLPFADHTA